MKPVTNRSCAQIAELCSRVVRQDQVTEHRDGPASLYRMHAAVTVCPENERQVQELLRLANEEKLRVAPRGGGTKETLGQQTGRMDIILSLEKMSGVIRHSAGDLICTVLPGTTMKQLADTLAKENQYLPIDAPWPEQSTIGGVTAANVSGFKRALYGSVRDYLIATRVVYPDGTVVRNGAKVVKNVAGYDMNKLFIGSMGTLGVITELTFKLRPLPSSAGLAIASANKMSEVKRFIDALLDSQLEPCVVEIVNPQGLETALPEMRAGGPSVFVGFEDNHPSVHYQMGEAEEMMRKCGLAVLHKAWGRDGCDSLLSRLHSVLPNARTIGDDSLHLSVKIGSRLSDVPNVYEAAEQHGKQCGIMPLIYGGAYTGISRVVITAESGQDPEAAEWFLQLRRSVEELNGYAVLESAPHHWRERIDVWGTDGPALTIMRKIKQSIDPNGILNAGRFAGGI